jgi:hypothetical protein
MNTINLKKVTAPNMGQSSVETENIQDLMEVMSSSTQQFAESTILPSETIGIQSK